MDTAARDRIEKIIADRQAAHQTLLGRGSPAYRAFLALEKAAFEAGSLERKTKELIALGISVVINCESCMEWHIRQAQLAGERAAAIRANVQPDAVA